MEVILKQDAQPLGFKDEIVTVKNGYGRNYLIPKGYGILATETAVKVLTENLKQQTKKDKDASNQDQHQDQDHDDEHDCHGHQ